MKYKLMALMTTGLCAVAAAGQAHAEVDMYCSNGTATEGIATTDVTYDANGANPPPAVSATDCYGVNLDTSIYNSPAAVTGLANTLTKWFVDPDGGGPLPAAGNWAFLTKADISGSSGSGTATMGGIQFTLTADLSGDWTLTAVDTNGTDPLNLPLTLDFIVTLKGGNNMGLWFFDDASAYADNDGTYSIVFKNNGNQIPDLSHMDLLVRNMDGTLPPVVIPEPASLALVGLGLAGLSVLRRRRIQA